MYGTALAGAPTPNVENAINKSRNECDGMAKQAACRMSARTALLDEAERLRRRAIRLETLARQIPDGFPADADEALFDLLYSARR